MFYVWYSEITSGRFACAVFVGSMYLHDKTIEIQELFPGSSSKVLLYCVFSR